MSATQIQKARGLSYSSFTEYSACPRKYYLRKIKKVEIDSDADASTEAMDTGKYFHRVLEVTNHDLAGFTFKKCAEVGREFGIEDEDTVCLVFAMVSRYKVLHEKTNLKVLACEVVIDAPGFYGVIDLVLQDSEGLIWITDLKTAATFQQSTVQSVTSHTQLLLYSRHYDLIAHAAGVKDKPFGGVRLRTTTKSKLQRKPDESIQDYIARMAKGIKSNDVVVPASLLKNIDSVYEQHQRANEIISKATIDDEKNFPPNFSSCMMFFRPCNYWQKCHGYLYTEAPKVEVVES